MQKLDAVPTMFSYHFLCVLQYTFPNDICSIMNGLQNNVGYKYFLVNHGLDSRPHQKLKEHSINVVDHGLSTLKFFSVARFLSFYLVLMNPNGSEFISVVGKIPPI